MRLEKIKNKYSKIISDYIEGDEKLDECYQFTPDWEGLEKALRIRQFTVDKRKTLVEALRKQYKNHDVSEKTLKNINDLEVTNTYTITTGHQLSLATGPLFFIYKIISVIKLTEDLKRKFPLYNFVPVYWMASEDHDFDEINHFHLFGKKYVWDSTQKGAVGEFDLDDLNVFDEIDEDLSIFKEAYSKFDNLSDATIYLVNELFKDYGLVIIEPQKRKLKRLFVNTIKNELLKRESFSSIESTNEKLVASEYKVQVNPREINLFYVDKGLRERIVFEDDKYKVLNTDLSFTEEDILNLVDEKPKRFSPNVVLRPVYQEEILPNLAYIGGPGEIAYWLQLKSNFDRLDVFFPVLILRDSFLILNKANQKTMDKLQLELADIFKDFQTLKKELVARMTDGDEFSLAIELSNIETLLTAVKGRTKDKSLHPAIDSEISKISKGLGNLEKRIQKSEERKFETALNQLKKLKEKLFPDGAPQERYENILNYYLNDNDFISKVYEHSDVLNNDLKVLFQD